MRAKEYKLMSRAVEEGVAYGWRRAHKHVEDPSDAIVLTEIEQAVINEICEWFEFRDEYEDSNDY